MFSFSHSLPIDTGLVEGQVLWEYKHTREELKTLEESDPYNFNCQQKQNPRKPGGNILKESWWRFYDELPPVSYKLLIADTAIKDGEKHDYTVFQCWGYHERKIYLMDQWRGKVKAVDLEDKFVDFWNKHNTSRVERLRAAYVEDKASGSQLIQAIEKNGKFPVYGIPRGKSKYERFINLIPWVEKGFVYIPREASWLHEYKEEFNAFSPLMTHKHDDQVDATLDAIDLMLVDAPAFDDRPKTAHNEQSKTFAPAKNSQKNW